MFILRPPLLASSWATQNLALDICSELNACMHAANYLYCLHLETAFSKIIHREERRPAARGLATGSPGGQDESQQRWLDPACGGQRGNDHDYPRAGKGFPRSEQRTLFRSWGAILII